MEKASKTVTIVRIASLVIGAVVIGIGVHSHFHSRWVQKIYSGPPFGNLRVYEICTSVFFKDYVRLVDKSCPSIYLEKYYVAMIIICFVVSLIWLIASCVIDLSSSSVKFVELGYHVLAAILLLIAAIVYLISTEQIKYLGKAFEELSNLFPASYANEDSDIRMDLRDEKIAASVLTILQAVLNGVIAILIGTQNSS